MLYLNQKLFLYDVKWLGNILQSWWGLIINLGCDERNKNITLKQTMTDDQIECEANTH